MVIRPFSQRHCQIVEEDRTIGAHVVKKRKSSEDKPWRGRPQNCARNVVEKAKCRAW